MHDLFIRRYTDSDLSSVKELHKLALQAINAYIEKGNWDLDLDAIEEIYLKDGEFLIGLIDNKVVAMGAFKKISTEVCEIKRMRVHPDFQRKGYGRKVLSELEDRAKKMGYKKVQLDTTIKQLASQQLYLKNGYIETGRKKDGPPIEMIFYKKTLI